MDQLFYIRQELATSPMTDNKIIADIIEREQAGISAINDTTDPNGMMHGHKVFGGMAINQFAGLDDGYQRRILIALYEWSVLGKLDIIGACVYEKSTKKRFICFDKTSWVEIPRVENDETRPYGHFKQDVNCVIVGHTLAEGPWYVLPTPTKEQYEALLAAEKGSK